MLRVLVFILIALGSSAAYATTPVLTDKPNPPTLASCQAWAGKQDPDAINMWGQREEGGSSNDLGRSRLTSSCMGDPQPDIVYFGSSAAFDNQFCKAHHGAEICSGEGQDYKDVFINKPGVIGDVSFCKGDQLLTPGTLVGSDCEHFKSLKVMVVSTSGSKLIVTFSVDNGPVMTMLAEKDDAKISCGAEDVPVEKFIKDGASSCGPDRPSTAATDVGGEAPKDAGSLLNAILKITPKDPKSDDCIVKATIDYTLFGDKLSDFRDEFLNRDYSVDFYGLRRKQVLAYIILKQEAGMITDDFYYGKVQQECRFSISVSYSDKFGQERSFEALTWRFSDDQSKKVNWQNFSYKNFDEVALDYRLSPRVVDWISDEPSLGEEDRRSPQAHCDMVLFNANAIFTRATATFCRKNYMDSKAGLAALEGARNCAMPEAEFKEKARKALLILDGLVRQRGRREACGFVEALANQIDARSK